MAVALVWRFRAIPTQVGKSLDKLTIYGRLLRRKPDFLEGGLKRAIFGVDPVFGYELEAAEFGIATTGFAFGSYAFDKVSLAVWVGGYR